MRRPRIFGCLGVLAACAWLALTPAAGASSPLQEYQQTGHITPCKYGAGQLQGDVPNDVAQYAPEYLSSLQAAARERARGCGGGGGAIAATGGQQQSGSGIGGGGAAGPGGGGGGRAPAPPKAVAAKPIGPPLVLPRSVSPTSSGVGTTPGPVLGLAVLAGLALLALILALVARLLGWGAGWSGPGRHAVGEAGMRAGSALRGAADWLRARRATGT